MFGSANNNNLGLLHFKPIITMGYPLRKGSSIHDVHTEGGGVRLRWTPVDGGGYPAPFGRQHRKLKLVH